MTTLQPGTYTLSQDVKNPKPDRRLNSNWTARPTWLKGSTFIVFEEPVTMPEGMPDGKVVKLTMVNALYRLSLSDARAKALIKHLVRVQETPSQWLNRVANGLTIAPEILDYLVASGKLTEAEFKAAYDHCIGAEPDKE